MKLAEPDNPVRFSWLTDQGHRLSPGPYVSDGYAARMLLKNFPRTQTLAEVTSGRIFRPGIFKRQYTTDPEHGIPFLSSADIFQSDLSSLAMLTRKSHEKTKDLPLDVGWTLITRSGMTAGRVTYVRPDMAGYGCSEHVIRVVPDLNKISAGYLYTLLSSPTGVATIRGNIYGTSVRHIEPMHLLDLPVPRLAEAVERRIDDLFQKAMTRRSQFQDEIVKATQDLFESAGLPELIDLRWHEQPRDISFCASSVNPMTLRALNLSPRAHKILARLRSVPHRTLGDICAGGALGRGNRFTRIDSSPGHGLRLVGQRQVFWMNPEGRWILLKDAEAEMIRARSETVLVASQGTLGDSEVFCRAAFVYGRWQREYAFSEHFMRIVSGVEEFPGAYLFAFLRSDAAFRVFRSMSTGGKQQDIHEVLRREIPVPKCTSADRERIAETVRLAYRWRDEADALEDKAQSLLAGAMVEASKKE